MDELTPSANAFDVLRSRKKPALSNPNERSAQQSAKFFQTVEGLSCNDQLSTFSPNASNTVSDGEICLIAMRPHETLCFQGTALVGSLMGCCFVLNYKIKAEPNILQAITGEFIATKTTPTAIDLFPCFSPCSSSLLVIESGAHDDISSSSKPFKAENPRSQQFYTSSTLKTLSLLYKKLMSSISQDFSTIVIVKKYNSSGIQSIEHMLPSCKGLFKGTTNSGTDIIRIPGFYPIIEPQPGLFSLKYDSTWLSVCENIRSHSGVPIVCITGSKNTGKSTLSKSMINSLFERFTQVAYLECDLGQSEFTPSGFLSLVVLSDALLGPSFTHQLPKSSHRSIYMGTATSWKDPEVYVSSIISLFETYKSQLKDLPLIINTHGWVKGMGYDLLIHLVNTIKATHIVCMQVPGKESFADALIQNLYSEYNPPIIVNGVTESVSKISSADQRTLSFLAYFSQNNPFPNARLNVSLTSNFVENIVPSWEFQGIIDRIPFCVPMNKINISFPYDEVPVNEVLYALNCSAVGLIGVDAIGGDTYQLNAAFPKVNGIAKSYLGMVRGVHRDMNGDHVLQIVSSPCLALHDVESMNYIIRGGGMEIPASFLIKGVDDVRSIPYATWVSTLEGVGSLAKRPRKNMQRKRLHA